MLHTSLALVVLVVGCLLYTSRSPRTIGKRKEAEANALMNAKVYTMLTVFALVLALLWS
jgi:hypothetical protein